MSAAERAKLYRERHRVRLALKAEASRKEPRFCEVCGMRLYRPKRVKRCGRCEL